MPHAARPFAELHYAMIYKGGLGFELKAAMGLRVAQMNHSPYVAAQMARALRGSPRGRQILEGLRSGRSLPVEVGLALGYAEALTRSVHGVSRPDFQKVRAGFDDSQLVELTLAVSFFNYFTRYAEALRLPVEAWVPEGVGPSGVSSVAPTSRVALISDEEIAAVAVALAAVKEQSGRPGAFGIGLANSQRAMLRVPALGLAWRAFGAATREKETVSREIKLQISLAVSLANGCRYCTLHQVLGLRRLGVDPGKLVALRKDDSALTQRERTAVLFARALTARPGGVTDEEAAAVWKEYGEAGALEVIQQACNFAFMNRFTDGLELPSEDEAIRVYREVYGGGFAEEVSLKP
jgi:AhpD family alkylhydroperoxidase